MGRKRRLMLVEVGEGLSCSRQSVEDELEAALTAEQARADANEDDETQLPSSLQVLKCNV